MIDIAIKHEGVILDACCLINLYASGRPEDILRSLGRQVFVARYVWNNEALSINGAPDPGSDLQETEIDMKPLIDGGLIRLADLETEGEEMAFVDLAASLDDGEAITGAIAIARDWCIATDDRRARAVFSRQAPPDGAFVQPGARQAMGRRCGSTYGGDTGDRPVCPLARALSAADEPTALCRVAGLSVRTMRDQGGTNA